MNFKELVSAMKQIEENNTLSEEIIIDAMKEALAKAYAKHTGLPDVQVRVEFNPADKQIHLYQQRTVVEAVEDDEFEISLSEAQKRQSDAKLGDIVEDEVSMDGFSRQAVGLVKNVLKQKIREAQKQIVYDEYIDKLTDIVIGTVDKVEERFVLVKLDKAQAMMPRNAQMPQERYVEGQPIKVVITEVNRDTKGSQVLVSRADANLVKRLFENEVPEIYQGIVEIKAIAREAGERTKMAVYSHKEEVDPIGACIGPRGSRVQVVIEELKGEKIDIFQWSDNISELIKNALSPAHVDAVLPAEDGKNLLVVVDDDQLSLAIGKKGKNVRLAVSLTDRKIDIKTRSDVAAMGIDVEAKLAEMAAKEAEARMEREREEARRQAELERQREAQALEEALQMQPNESEEEVVEDVPLFEEVVAEPEKVVEKRRKPKLQVKASDYISKFEALADASRPTVAPVEKSYKKSYDKKKDDDERRLRLKDMKRDMEYEIRPEYSQEELEEIRRQEELEQDQWNDDIDYDEYDSYYDED